MKRTSTLVAAATLIIASSAFAATEAEYIAKAKEFVQLLVDKEYEQATKMFDATMTDVVPVGRLEGMWNSMSLNGGPCKGIEKSAPTVTHAGQYTIVYVPCAWQSARYRVRVVFDAQLRVAGLAFDEPASEGTGIKPDYLDPAAVTQRDVTIGEGAWKVPGTIAIPANGKTKAGIVFVHGSGPNDRDETIGPNKPFRDLAFGLGLKGIATLRYDKRTLVHGGRMVAVGLTVDEEAIDDALLALDVIRKQKELAGKPIFLLGHSLGAMLGPEIAEKDGKLDGLIMLAGPARPFEDVIVDQHIYLASLNPSAEAARQLDELQEEVDRLRRGELKSPRNVLGADVSYWYDLMARDADVMLKRAANLPCPILVLQGGRDYQSKVVDFEMWKKALRSNKKAKCILWEDLNHLFAPGKGMATPTEYTADEKYVDQKVIDAIASWCSQQ